MSSPSLAPAERSGPRAGLLLKELGWKRLRGEPRALVVGEAAYQLTPLAHRAGVHALHCEALPGTGFPAYAERLAVRRRAEPSHADALIVFTDAAHSAEVWSWRQPGVPCTTLREESRRPDALDARLLWRLAELGAALAGRRREEPAEKAATAVLTALLRQVQRRAPPALARSMAAGEGVDPHARLRALVEGAGDPVAVRTLWRALRELRVLDPACGRGDWLLSARRCLAAVYEGCLDRMQSWVDDLEREHGLHRSTRLADFRSVLERADDVRLFAGRAAYACEAALLLNLCGVDRDASAVAVCRRRLRSGARTGARLTPGICSVRVGEVCATSSPSSLESRFPGLAEEVEAVGRAELHLRRMRLEAALPSAELKAALLDVAERRARIRRKLRRLPGGARALHLWAEFPVGAGGFHLVREVGDD